MGIPINEITKIGNDTELGVRNGLINGTLRLPYKKQYKIWVPEVGKYFIVETSIEDQNYNSLIEKEYFTLTITAQ